MYGWRSQIGFIVPVNNTVFEPEMYHLVPEGVPFHFTKIVVSGPEEGRTQEREAADILHRSPRSGWPDFAKDSNECSPTMRVAASERRAPSRSWHSGQHHRRWNGEAASGLESPNR